MTIYILDNDPVLCAQALDDRSLDKQIKAIAQTLCNVHYLEFREKPHSLDCHVTTYECKDYLRIPLKPKRGVRIDDKWADWASECKANYLYLVELGTRCEREFTDRFNKPLKINRKDSIDIFVWARNNVPDLKEIDHGFNYQGPKWTIGSPFPLVMPKRYLKIFPYKMVNIIESYRNYYQAKLKQKLNKVNK